MLIADDWYLLLEMALHRQCKAAFSLTPRWTKRVDGTNIYDGQPPTETIRKLHLQDRKVIRSDFRSRLTRSERFSLVRRELKYRLFLFYLRKILNSGFTARVRKVPVITAPLRSIVRWILT